MQTPLNTILNLLIESPGNIIYHLALAFSVISSLQAALISQRSRKDLYSNRLVLGLAMLLLGQAVLFFSSGLAWQNVLDERTFLPPLDRAVMLFSLVWIIWLWAFPKPARLGDLVTGFLNLGVVLLFLFSYTSWGQENTAQHFNNTWIDQAWELAALFLVITGMAILIFSRPAGWEYGMGMLCLILAGNVAHLLMAPSDKDFSGYIRIAQLAAYPLLPTLLNRLSLPILHPSKSLAQPLPAAQNQGSFPRSQERRRYSADPRTVHAWLTLMTAKEPAQILAGITRALAQTMLSDICFYVSGPTFGQVVLQIGYDLIREETIPGISLAQGQVSALAAALQRGKNLSITPNEQQLPDLKVISTALGFKETGSLLFISLTNAGKPEGGLLFLSPYSNRQWNSDDEGFLSSEVEIINDLFQRVLQPTTPATDISTLPADNQVIEKLRSELDSLRQDNQLLLMELSDYRSIESKPISAAPDLDITALVALQQESQEQLSHLQAENERLLALLGQEGSQSSYLSDLSSLETELRSSLQDNAMLQNRLAEANARNLILEREVRQTDKHSDEDLEVITSVVQEIRQPMASINGYTELLLSESVGILGALQRKFLERIFASTERLRSILDDLIRVTTISEGPIELLPQSVDLETIIDGAVSDISGQLREKNIGMRVDLPEVIPQIFADRDAIQQIILHLLQNAGTATPQESTISLRARIQMDHNDDFLLLQVTDNGGGVRAEDLPRVFARHYRAEKPLIQGLGDTGVGLSIAKTLVEAHGGRIWVDSILGQSTTFSVLLPLHPNYNGSSVK